MNEVKLSDLWKVSFVEGERLISWKNARERILVGKKETKER